MSGLLRRLASQAVAGGSPRVRAAASLRRPPPIVIPSSTERPESGQKLTRDPVLTARADAPSRRSGEANESAPARGAELRVGSPEADSQREREHEPSPPPRLLPELERGTESVRAETTFAGDALQVRYSDEPRALEQRDARESEPTEVHVHIGRIEVTAVHEPAARRSKRELQRPTPTLEDYLAVRRTT